MSRVRSAGPSALARKGSSIGSAAAVPWPEGLSVVCPAAGRPPELPYTKSMRREQLPLLSRRSDVKYFRSLAAVSKNPGREENRFLSQGIPGK